MTFKPSFTSQLPKKTFLEGKNLKPFLEYETIAPSVEIPEIPHSIRNYHTNIIGNIGVGKSTLIAWWAFKDILSGYGPVCVIDPKGDLVRDLMRVIPDDRIDDCIFVDINDPAPLDFMRCAPGNEDDVVHDLKFMLMGEATDSVTYPFINKNIENLLFSLIDANKHPDLRKEEHRHLRCTFLDVAEFWEDEDRQKFIIDHITNEKLRRTWKKLPSENDREKIIARINPFIRSSTLSKIFGDPNPRLDIDEIIRQNKILLVSVPVEKRGSAAYGKFLMAKIQHAMFSVEDQSKRIPLFLYVDEFQNFPTSENFHRVVDMGRGFLLCFTLSVTRLDLLTPSMISALGIIGSYVVLQMNVNDRSFYEKKVCRDDPNKDLREKERQAAIDLQLCPPGDSRDRLQFKWNALQEMVKKLPPAPVSTEQLADLNKFQAIYKIGDAPSVIQPTPTPMSKILTDREKQKVQTIIEQSKIYRSSYAESSTKRSGDNASSNTSQNPHTEGNGKKDEDIPGSGAV
ncbi:MAG TPA: hypothetical protein VKR52_00670 [Terracidiphilus sp.]|nr:hypothetical protein [Terracidiphilus sp.]